MATQTNYEQNGAPAGNVREKKMSAGSLLVASQLLFRISFFWNSNFRRERQELSRDTHPGVEVTGEACQLNEVGGMKKCNETNSITFKSKSHNFSDHSRQEAKRNMCLNIRIIAHAHIYTYIFIYVCMHIYVSVRVCMSLQRVIFWKYMSTKGIRIANIFCRISIRVFKWRKSTQINQGTSLATVF